MTDRTDEVLKAIRDGNGEVLKAIEGRRQQDSVTGITVVEELRGLRTAVNWLKEQWKRLGRAS